MYNQDWFLTRGMKYFPDQEEAINLTWDSLIKNPITVLAACPGAGKTIMSVFIIEQYLIQNPEHKVLVLTHGLSVLRSQYHERCSNAKPSFSYNLVESRSEFNQETHVNITLPQTIIRDIPEVDLMIIDEGHQFYFASMVQEILEKSKPKKQLILTGTPSPFILRNIPIIPVALNQISDRLAKLTIEMACSNYDFKLSDFNSDNEIVNPNFQEEDTNKSLEQILSRLIKGLKSRKIHKFINFRREWFPVLQELKKTMIACKSQEQAKQIKEYFENQKIKVALSISDINENPDENEIERFKREKDCLVLIVVQRGILGFDYPDLINVIDMTMSYNIDRIYQLMCRTIRPNEDKDLKLFVKVVPTTLREYYKYIMTAVLCLSEKEFLLKFNGKNFKEMEIPVKIKRNKLEEEKEEKIENNKNQKEKIPSIEFEDLMVLDLIKEIYHTGNSILESYAFTTIQKVREQFLNQIQINYTFEEIKEDALKFKTISEWRKSSKQSMNMYGQSKIKGWFEEVTAHMKKLRNIYTFEEIKEDALKFKTLSEWRKFSYSSYRRAKGQKWLEEVTSHMEKIFKNKKINYIFEEIKKDALKFKTKAEWTKSSKQSNNMYNQARRKGWLEEVTSHMEKREHNNYTFEEIKKDALKFKTINEWKKSSKQSMNMYGQSKIKGWFEEVTAHMEKLKTYYTLEEIKKDALKFKTKAEWTKSSKKSSNMYNQARRKGWFEEVTAHMEKKEQNSYTFEEIKKDALKFKTKVKWKKSSKKSSNMYQQAKYKGWFEEVTAHMEKIFITHSYTFEEIKEDAFKFKTISGWKKSSNKSNNMYQQAKRKGWFEEVTAHMEKLHIEVIYILEEIKEDALKFKTKAEWKKSSKQSMNMYQQAKRKGWLEEVTVHMKKRKN